MPNKVIVEELNDEINTLKKENATLLERLEDVRKVVSTYYYLCLIMLNLQKFQNMLALQNISISF